MSDSKKNIYRIPHSSNFLECLAKGILERERSKLEQLHKVQVFLPNKRTITHLKYEFVKASKTNATFLPDIKSIGSDNNAPPSLELQTQEIDKLSRVSVLNNLIKSYPSTELKFSDLPLSKITSISFSLIELIDDCLRYKTDNLEGLNNILPEELAAHRQASVLFLEYIFKNYPLKVKQQDKIDPIEKRNAISERTAEIFEKNGSEYGVYIAGSTGTLPSTRRLIKSIHDLDNGHVILPYIDLDCSDRVWNDISAEGNIYSHQQTIKSLIDFLEIHRNDVQSFYVNEDKVNFSKTASVVMQPLENSEDWKTLNHDNIKNTLGYIELDNLSNEAHLASILAKEAIIEGKSCAIITEDYSLVAYIKNIIKNYGTDIDSSINSSFAQTNEGVFLLNCIDFLTNGFKSLSFIEILKSPINDKKDKAETLKLKNFINDLEINFIRRHRLFSFTEQGYYSFCRTLYF